MVSAAGAKVRAACTAGMKAFAESIASYHRAALPKHPDWPKLSDMGYLGIVGASPGWPAAGPRAITRSCVAPVRTRQRPR